MLHLPFSDLPLKKCPTKGPFRTKNAMALKPSCFTTAVVFYYPYQFAAIFHTNRTVSNATLGDATLVF